MPDANNNANVTIGPPDLGWTVTTLKAYVDAAFAFTQHQFDQLRVHYNTRLEEIDRRYEARFQAQEKAVGAALLATQTAINKSEAASESRFASVNEFRSQLGDQARTFMPRAEAVALHASTHEKIEYITATRAMLMPRAEAIASLAALQEKIDSLQTRIDRTEGRAGGFSAGWGYIVGAAGLVLTLMTIGGVLFALTR